MIEKPLTQTHVIISGKVQGVWYRAWTADQAKELGLSGWVQNLSNGSVEALICGEQSAIQTMLERFQEGPKHARVEKVEILEREEMSSSSFSAFQIRR